MSGGGDSLGIRSRQDEIVLYSPLPRPQFHLSWLRICLEFLSSSHMRCACTYIRYLQDPDRYFFANFSAVADAGHNYRGAKISHSRPASRQRRSFPNIPLLQIHT
jgi:hypothetical protein